MVVEGEEVSRHLQAFPVATNYFDFSSHIKYIVLCICGSKSCPPQKLIQVQSFIIYTSSRYSPLSTGTYKL